MLHTRGIVLRTIKYGDTSVIADIFTAEKGLCTFIGGGVRSAKSKMPYGLFQPMTVVDLVSYYRDDHNALHRLRELKAGLVWQGIPFDLKRGAVVLFMAEICRKCIQVGEINEEIFDFLIHTLNYLDTTTDPIANIHLYFLVQLSGLLGFQPEAPDNATELYFDLKDNAFVPLPPIHPDYLNPEELAQVLTLQETNIEDCHLLPLVRSARKVLMNKLLDFYRHHVPNFTDIHTPEVLDMVF